MNENESGMTRRGFLCITAVTGAGFALGFHQRAHGTMTTYLRSAGRSEEEIIVGFDVGTSKMCAAVAKVRSDGIISIMAMGRAPSRGVRRGQIVDFECAQDSVVKALVNAEMINNVMIQSVYLGTVAPIRNVVRCLKQVPVAVDDVVLNPLASAKAVLDADQKNLGALVIDIGGGSTDYLVYIDGAVRQSGSVAMGGDPISREIASCLGIPPWRAERLKIEEGSVTLGATLPGKIVTLKSDGGFPPREVERETLNSIIQIRTRQMLECVKSRLDISGVPLNSLGAGVQLTGGYSLLRGIDDLAGEVFGLPVCRARVKGVSGPPSILEDPRYSCAIGLVKHSHESIFG